MDFKETLLGKLKKYKDVIIYGYMDIGTCVLDYIIDLETNIKIANYSRKVRYFAYSSPEETTSNRHDKKGIAIKSIHQLTAYADKALVIIATQEQYHKEITETLDELHFKNRLYVTHEAYCLLRETAENHKGIMDNRIMQYHTNHRMKLDLLRAKVQTGKKGKVFFMVHDAAVFGCDSIYQAMEKDVLFEPYVFVVSRRDVDYKFFYEDVLKDVRFFEEKGYRTVNAYDEQQNPKDLHVLNPDIIFYDLPKMHDPAGNYYFRLDHINWEFLTCYVPYGLLMVDSFYYHYHTTCIRETWKYFMDTPASFKRISADGEFNGFNTVLSGYPKFDDYYADMKREDLPSKLQNDRRTIIYAPHHSLGVSNNFATFDLYKDVFMDLLHKHPNINFVFKPHPLLPFQIMTRYKNKKSAFSYEDYLDYMNQWDSMPNGLCLTQGDYIKVFRCSDCMITDCGSFIGEYLPSLNPCIYLFNPRKERQEDAYTPLAKEILDTYYVCKTLDEMEYYVENVAISGNDEKRKTREALFHKEFANIGNAGAFIRDYLKSQLIL